MAALSIRASSRVRHAFVETFLKSLNTGVTAEFVGDADCVGNVAEQIVEP